MSACNSIDTVSTATFSTTSLRLGHNIALVGLCQRCCPLRPLRGSKCCCGARSYPLLTSSWADLWLYSFHWPILGLPVSRGNLRHCTLTSTDCATPWCDQPMIPGLRDWCWHCCWQSKPMLVALSLAAFLQCTCIKIQM